MRRFLKVWALLALVAIGLVMLASPGNAAFLKDYLIWDPDINKSSGPRMDGALKTLGYCGDYEPGTAMDFLGYNFQDYASVFICLGVFPDNYVFGSMPGDAEVADSLLGYLSFTNPPDTPHIYMEGGDTWMYDWTTGAWTVLHPMFRVDTTCGSDGEGDLDIITGVTGTCMEGLSPQYSGENQFIDRLCKLTLTPPDTTVYLFENGPDSVYYSAVGYRPGGRQYVSIASSSEFGGIDTSLQIAVMDSIMGCFFEQQPGGFALDGAALRVVTPGPFSVTGVQLFPEIEARNAGTSTITMLATCTINPGAYLSQVTIPNVLPATDVIAAFPDGWIPSTSCISYDVTMWVEVLGDLNDCNDTTQSTTFSWNTTSVFNSPFTSNPPAINGSMAGGEWADAESLDVSDILNRGGTGAMSCNSAWMYVKNDNSFVYFAIDAPAEVTFDIFDTYMLYFDDNNDDLFDPAGTEGRTRLIAYPPAAGADTVRYTPYNACIATEIVALTLQGAVNFTAGHVQFELQIPLNPAGTNEELSASPGDTVGMWINVADGFGTGRSVGWWPTTSNFNFGAACPDPSLMGDLILAASSLFVDVGVVNVLAPADTVCPDSCYNPQVIVQNIGGIAATFDVGITIGTFYADTQTVFLAGGQDTVTFNTACFPPDTGAIYALFACTILPTDVNPTNDCSGKSIFADPICSAYHDVGVVSVNVIIPPGTTCVFVGDTVLVDATVENFGNFYTESFSVRSYTTPASYNPPDVNIDSLTPGNQSAFVFVPPWVISASDSGCYSVIVKTLGLPSDTITSNDSLFLTDVVCVCLDTTTVGTEESPNEALPAFFTLYQSQPNPARGGVTEIRYALPEAAQTDLSIYDVTGRLVVVLKNGNQQAGYHSAFWNGRDSVDRPAGNGIYFYRLRAGDFVATRKMVVLR